LKLIFFSQETYPEGGAACNRHLAYIDGLASRGHDVCLHAIGNQARSYRTPNFDIVGVHISAHGRFLFHIKACFAMLLLCLQQKNNPLNDLKWIYLGTSGLLLLPLMIIARIYGINTFHERTELPSLMVGNGLLNKLDYALYKSLLRWFSGIYVISSALQHQMQLLAGASVKIEIVNMIVDLSRFQNIAEEQSKDMHTIIYCGDLSSPKDGVDILIRAFAEALACSIEPKFVLKLAGATNNEYTKRKLRPLVDELKLNSQIEFLGQIRRQDVPRMLSHSDLLVLARPSSEQASYGFPTKLGEYLASKKPVLVTNTGEISKYLTDGVDVFLAPPDDVAAFAERICNISQNYQEALRIGHNGYAAANKHFSASSAARRIENILMNS
jgi:glycosyltransferase involved in cell wall biosynthesis